MADPKLGAIVPTFIAAAWAVRLPRFIPAAGYFLPLLATCRTMRDEAQDGPKRLKHPSYSAVTL